MSKIVWDINAYNWEQDSQYLWQQGAFNSSLWVDVRKEPPFVKLSSKMTEEWTFDDEILYMVNLEDFWLTWILTCLKNWKIYLNWTLKHTLSDWTNAYNRIIWVSYNVAINPYLYYFTQTSSWSYKIYKSDTSVTAWSFTTLWTYTTRTWNTQIYYPTISENERIIAWVWNKIIEIDNADVVTTLIEFSSNEHIVKITDFQNSYRVYTTIIADTLKSTWKQYLWDWVSDTYEYLINWNNQPIQAVTQNGAYDYAITGFTQYYSDLYKVSWSQKSLALVNLEESSISWKKRLFYPYISTRTDIIYMSWENKEWINCIYSLWNYYPWFANATVAEYAKTTTDDSDAFTFHSHTNNKSYFANTNKKVYSISYTNPTTYFNNWYVVTKRWTWSWLHTIKSIDYMYVWYKLDSSATSIKVYASNWNGTFKLLKEITDTSKKWIRIEANEFKSLDLWDFYELELKFELITTDTSKTPALWRVLVFCNEDYNK